MRFKLVEKVEHLRRYRHILAVLMKYGFDEVVDALRRRLTLRMGASAVPKHIRRAADGRSRRSACGWRLQNLDPRSSSWASSCPRART